RVGDARECELARVAFRIHQSASLVLETGVGQKLLGAGWTVGCHLLRELLHRWVRDPLWEQPAETDRVCRGLVAVLPELPDRLAVDCETDRLAEGDEAI